MMRQSASIPVRLLVVLLVAAAVGCRPTPPPGSPEARARLSPLERERTKLAQARAAWQRQNLTSYGYTLRRRCFCPPPASEPIQVTVRGGQPTAVLAGRGTPAPAEAFAGYDTVEELFAMADSALARRPAAARVIGTYDATTGFPVSLQVNPDARKNDDEFGFFVSDFRRNP